MTAAGIALTLALVAVSADPVLGLPEETQTLSEFLWYEHPINTGHLSCNRSVRRQQEKFVDQRFKRRIARLRQAYKSANGDDPPLEVIVPLRCVADRGAVDETLKRGMADFDVALKKWERKYGLAK